MPTASEHLERIKAYCEAASLGWERTGGIVWRPEQVHPDGTAVQKVIGNFESMEDAACAAHARTDLPRLVKATHKYATFLGALQFALRCGEIGHDELADTVQAAGDELTRILDGEA